MLLSLFICLPSFEEIWDGVSTLVYQSSFPRRGDVGRTGLNLCRAGSPGLPNNTDESFDDILLYNDHKLPIPSNY